MMKICLMSCGFVIYISVIWMMDILCGLSSVCSWTHESFLMVWSAEICLSARLWWVWVFSSLSTDSMSCDESERPAYCSVRVHHHHHHHHHHHGVSQWLTSNPHLLLLQTLRRSGLCDGLLKLLITSYLCDVVGGGLCSGGMWSEIPALFPRQNIPIPWCMLFYDCFTISTQGCLM